MWRRAGSADDLDHEVVEPEDLWEFTGDNEGVGPEGSELLRCPEWDETVRQHEAFLAEPMDFRALFETRSAAAAAPSEGASSVHSAGRGSECPLAPRQRPAQDQAESSDTETELGLIMPAAASDQFWTLRSSRECCPRRHGGARQGEQAGEDHEPPWRASVCCTSRWRS